MGFIKSFGFRSGNYTLTNLVSTTVTVNAASSTATATIPTGATILGIYVAGNQDQTLKSTSLVGTTLTLTLAANATANNVFNVVYLKGYSG
jgi:hypothetical protein